MNKYFYRALIQYGDGGAVMYPKHSDIKDCKNDLLSFLNEKNLKNDVTCIGIKKFNAETGEDVSKSLKSDLEL